MTFFFLGWEPALLDYRFCYRAGGIDAHGLEGHRGELSQLVAIAQPHTRVEIGINQCIALKLTEAVLQSRPRAGFEPHRQTLNQGKPFWL